VIRRYFLGGVVFWGAFSFTLEPTATIGPEEPFVASTFEQTWAQRVRIKCTALTCGDITRKNNGRLWLYRDNTYFLLRGY
jgi:hypothetical protein